jgi:5-methylcytosine-specific restriction endonuclease McrA/energy-coupling factor transporter ATP-binding protein EcfA2
MNKRTEKALLGRGLSTDLIKKIGSNSHTVTSLRTFSRKTLKTFYTDKETELIQQCIQRNPIADDVIDQLLFLSNGVCCYCADGNSTRPYQVHHIVEHSISHDDSLENLMLICPTHHSDIPRRTYSVEEQKGRRAEWYAIAEIERAYRARGIPFPHQSFEALVYSTEPSVKELFLFRLVSPSTARIVSQHSLGTAALDKLQREHFLIIAGDSGSGKSTLAIGVAGSVPGKSRRVYGYVPPLIGDNRQAVQEIMTFINTAAEPCLLIIDDINLWATIADIKRIARASTAAVKVIATATRELSRSEEPSVDMPFPFNRLFISWEIVRPFVTDFLRSHEPEVIVALTALRGDSPFDRVGFTPMDPHLAHLIERYENEAKSIWQFLFLLSAGWNTIENDLAELINDGRADVPVVYAAIEQIADAERAVAAEETALATAALRIEGPLPAPDTKWVTSVFEHLVVNRRVIIRMRNSYTTVHRDWARTFICAALGNSQSRESTVELLQRYFNLATPRPRQFATLLSWLKYRANCDEFIREWALRQKREDWPTLVGAAVHEGLAVASSVASQIYSLHRTEEWKEIIADAFEAHEAAITRLVIGASPQDWHYLRDLFGAISHARPSFAVRVIESWEPAIAAEVFNRTHPDYYDSMTWFLGGSIWKHSLAWCYKVGEHVDWSAISSNLSQVRKGDIEGVEHCLSILRRLGIPIMRSMVRRITEIICDKLEGAHLNDIRFESGMIFVIEVFPKEMRKIADALDARSLAAEISHTLPHKWSELMHLSWIGARAGSTFPQDLVEYLDDDRLEEAVRKYAEYYPRIFLPLLWQLAYGRPERRRELAAKLYQSALVACRQTESEREDILRAFLKIDEESARNLTHELNVDLPIPEAEDEIDLNRPLLERSEERKETKEQLRALEESGQDYDVGIIINGPYRTSSDDEPGS